jgi:aldose 1-epimerase
MRRHATGYGMMLSMLVICLGGGLWAPGHPTRAEGKDKVQTTIQKMPFGTTADGTPVDLYVLTNAKGMQAKITTYGGIVTELLVPDKSNKSGNVVLGFDDLKGYLAGHPYFGAIIGRVANRIGMAKFTLDGKEYTLAANNGPNHLHGGKIGFDKKVWKAETLHKPGGAVLQLSYRSPNGEEGYPGNLDVVVFYSLTAENELRIDYQATTDRATPVNLSNHSYFNLRGPEAGNILDHEILLAADHYTPVDDSLIPTGKISPVLGTPMDFTKPTRIGARIAQVGGDPAGYDHNYVLRGGGKGISLAARVRESTTGRIMEMYTTEPGVQFYTGNFLDGTVRGHGGVAYRKHQGFCLEAQHFPDAVHHANFPSIILRPGKTYQQTTVYKFLVQH